MKSIVIAYDGSECSEAIFTELQHADTATLGTVASALAVRAHCSVEIVRP